MSSTFTGRKSYTCTQCHRKGEVELHVYAATNEILVFGHSCDHCRTPSAEVSATLRGLKEQEESLIFHYVQQNSGAWCMHCDTPTSVEFNEMHAHMRDVHPELWATISTTTLLRY